MPAFTSFLNLYKPGGGSTGLILPDEVADIDRLNQNADLIDAFAAGWGDADDRNQQRYGPAAGLVSQTGMKLGDTYQESDGKKILWRYDGSNWVTNESGMVLIRPSNFYASAGGGVVLNDDGSISWSGVSTGVFVGAQGVFSNRYRAYKVVYQHLAAAASANWTWRFLQGSTIIVATNYSYQVTFGSAATVGGTSATGQGTGLFSANSTTRIFAEHTIQNPTDASVGTHNSFSGIAGNLPIIGAGAYVTAAAMDGFCVASGSAASEGWMKVYGLL